MKFEALFNLPTAVRRVLLVVGDTFAVLIAVWAAFAIRRGEMWPELLPEVAWLFPLAVVIVIPTFTVVGVYRPILRYADESLLYTIILAVSASILLLMAVWVLLGDGLWLRSFWLLCWLVLTALAGGGRLLMRRWLRRRFRPGAVRTSVILYGAGEAGVQLALALRYSAEFEPVAFVDDNPQLWGSIVRGLKVWAPVKLPRLIAKHEASLILLALPSTPHRRRQEILESLAGLPVRVMDLPTLAELTSGARRIDEFREIDVADILGRDSVQPNPALLQAPIRGQTVMVTGAGGSIGAELCRQILALHPRRLVLFERSEYALYCIEQELRTMLANMDHSLTPDPAQYEGRIELIPLLGSVAHRRRLQVAMEQFQVETVYHAAAYKHVPIVECNLIEGVQNNVFGTWRAVEAAQAAGVKTFVLVSTDKAVRPTNVMGATKRLAELILQGLAAEGSATRLCMVRFGNVLDSSGSVVPLFREQIRKGGPVTVTDPEVERYFMTIPEAAQLVIQASALAQGGEVFLLDMGEPVLILELARRMIRLSGRTVRDEEHPDGDIDIQFTGLRSGEKLREELLIGVDDEPTTHPMIRHAREQSLPWPVVRESLARLEAASHAFDYPAVRAILRETVAEYQPDNGIEDWVWRERLKRTGDSGDTPGCRA
ncbi:MAG TPA: nucleoside-diphosphate sugar epimerase/dehydratase [Candidatus Competibacteraceae bacterium]|nr:nucleoside-diphosphate sugar epimerase/dehydratase [Candidatus Competibacteraceae bacterium]HRZ05872.1 nucleoside-diphosphate sugar epimerase/dehydratase [Candidatus Competibacteraceae bacterium]HSA46004.1 nucleoside-diphosphate sugar epimerase/dehydratase [Candidatus Competibacteraceae bacterium]